jgi:hypothetical protein
MLRADRRSGRRKRGGSGLAKRSAWRRLSRNPSGLSRTELAPFSHFQSPTPVRRVLEAEESRGPIPKQAGPIGRSLGGGFSRT